MIKFAKFLALVWGLWWTYFGFATSIKEKLDFMSSFMHIILPGGLFLMTAVLMLKSELTAAVLLITEGVFIFLIYTAMAVKTGEFSFQTLVFLLITMILPPIIAGILVISRRIKKLNL